MKSIFLFHRDISVDDNIGLRKCIEESETVYAIFIFTPEQANPKINKYFSSDAFNFLLGSLHELNKHINVSFFYKDSVSCLKKLINELNIDAVWENRDFSPYAKRREKDHSAIAKKYNCKHILCESTTLLPMGTFTKDSKGKEAYVKFTPFYVHALQFTVPKPYNSFVKSTKISTVKLPGSSTLKELVKKYFGNVVTSTYIKSGRKEAINLLKKFAKNVSTYSSDRNYPSLNATSHLSPHLQFGTISPREVYHYVYGKHSTEFIQQLYWREFYSYISNYVITTYSKKSFSMVKFNTVSWSTSKTKLDDWKYGNTGIPIVDAGMRQLLDTGFMHNRLRMICAMYLIHFLEIHWKEGELWFAKNLVDYSYTNNYGGWTWCASTEVYSNPYFKIFSLKQQHKRFDSNSEFVKYWCPELKNLSNKEMWKKYDGLDIARQKRIEYLAKF